MSTPWPPLTSWETPSSSTVIPSTDEVYEREVQAGKAIILGRPGRLKAAAGRRRGWCQGPDQPETSHICGQRIKGFLCSKHINILGDSNQSINRGKKKKTWSRYAKVSVLIIWSGRNVNDGYFLCTFLHHFKRKGSASAVWGATKNKNPHLLALCSRGGSPDIWMCLLPATTPIPQLCSTLSETWTPPFLRSGFPFWDLPCSLLTH